MSKKWVFESLVKNDNDGVGLIAYALYKHQKHTLAKSLRDQGVAEDEIQRQVDTFHDQTLQTGSLETYKTKAVTYLNQVYANIEKEIDAQYDAEKKKLIQTHEATEKQTRRDCEKKIKKEQADFIKNVKTYEKDKKPIYLKLWEWLISGIPGVLASFVISAFVIGASVMLVPDSKKQEIFTSLATEYLGVKNPPEKERQ